MVTDSSIRRRLTASVLGRDVAPEPHRPEAVVSRGTVLDARSYLLVLGTQDGEERLIINAESTVWRGGEIDPAELTPGDEVLVRRQANHWTAQRVWSGLARVTGEIVERDGSRVTVDAGHERGQQVAIIAESAAEVFRARIPRLEVGFLFDAVGLWRGDVVEALVPATQQPRTPATVPPRRTLAKRHQRDTGHGTEIDGSVTWFDPAAGRTAFSDPLATTAGVAYPALDPQSDCAESCAWARGCVPLPLLSLGMLVSLRNLNAAALEWAAIPVTACGAMTRYFCDPCAQGAEATVPRGRIAEVTIASFLALGGAPETGCLPGRLTLPGKVATW